MRKNPIEILSFTDLRGPNMWSYGRSVEALVDIGELEQFPSNLLPGFYERLSQWLPGLVEHECSYEERGGFLRRLKEGTWTPHIMEHVALELQTMAGIPVGFGRARETSRSGLYKVVVAFRHEQVTRMAIVAARDLVMAAINDDGFDVAACVKELHDIADDLLLGPSTACIVEAAHQRDIPSIRLNDGNLVQLGYGAAQRRIWTAETDHTSAIAEGISRDKDLTKRLLSSCGVPVPAGRIVESIEDAWDAAQDIGLPVVLKPVDANHGRGVFVNLSERHEIEAAYRVAVDEGSGVMIEGFIAGDEHRLLVVGGQLVAAARGEVSAVTGDGRQTVAQLIESQINSDPRRGITQDTPVNRVRIDSAVTLELKQQGYTAESVIAEGQRVLIQRMGNVTTDITDRVHPTVAAAAALAAKVVGLDIAGIDLVTTDITKPLAQTGGAIVEVNAGPGLLMHLRPAVGEARPVGPAIVNHLFPDQADGRIPVIGISGTNPSPMLARLVAHMLQLSGRMPGVACSDGLYFDKRRVRIGDCTAFDAAQQVLINRLVEAAVIESSARSIAIQGLPYDRCAVGIVTSLDQDFRMNDLWIDSTELVYRVLRTQIDVVLKTGSAVLNADDPHVLEMAELSDGEVVLYSTRVDHPAILAHVADGKRAVVASGAEVRLMQGSTVTSLAPSTAKGQTVRLIEAQLLSVWLPAVAAAWALGVPDHVIRTGLSTFAADNVSVQGVAAIA